MKLLTSALKLDKDVRSGSVVECLTRDRWFVGSSLTGGAALVLEQDMLSSA